MCKIDVWFAWYPVELENRKIAWLRYVERWPAGVWGNWRRIPYIYREVES